MGPFYVRRKVRFPAHVLGSRGAHIGQARENFLFSFKPHPAPKPHRWKASSSAKHGRGNCFPVRQMLLGRKGDRSAKRYEKTCRTAGFLICSIFRFFDFSRWREMPCACARIFVLLLSPALAGAFPHAYRRRASSLRRMSAKYAGSGAVKVIHSPVTG